MAKYNAVNGVYRKVAKKYDPVDGVHRKVTKAFEPVGGVYRQYFSGDLPVETLAVGESVWLNVKGSLTEFLVVHQGNPDPAMYDASCDGTWLLMKKVYSQYEWDDSSNSYMHSDIHNYLSSAFNISFDSNIKSAIKRVKIPYWNYTGTGGTLASLSDGLSTNLFLLSLAEVGLTSQWATTEGACLDYFRGCAAKDAKRIAYNDDIPKEWWLRSPRNDNTDRAVAVSIEGAYYGGRTVSTSSTAVRPALILDSNTPIDNSTGINIIA